MKLYSALMGSVFSGPVWNAEGAGGGGGEGQGEQTPAAPESVLFPNEGKADDQGTGDKQADQSAGDQGKKEGEGDGDGTAEWKEYVPDPNKSDEENAQAKAEHDKTKPAADDKGDKNKADADKVPEDGKYVLAMPEGVEVDQELVDALGPEFKELGLTNAQAQKLADKFIAIQSARVGKQGETWANTLSGWVDQAKSDKEIGGDKWDATVASAQRATNALGTPELKEYLNASGGGNHPELIRFMAKVGAMIKEDNPANGGAEGRGKPADPAHVLFPNDAPKGK